jgi:ABC-type multidrug transport system permease subunit
MEDAKEEHVLSEDTAVRHSAGGWQILWFLLHLTAVYAMVKFCTPWLAGWTRGTLLPLLQTPTSSGRFEFLFSHILAFSFIPAVLFGLVNALDSSTRPLNLSGSCPQ